ncbi:MAG: ribonuclease J [Patescibacteria group bacterium]
MTPRKTIKKAPDSNLSLKVIPLGGLDEVGRNMTLLEYDKNIIIIDMGLRFPEEDMLGIDFIIPNIEYLKDKKDWVKAVFITHAHYDHIGAIPYLVEKLGYPAIYTTLLSKAIILKRQEDFPRMKKLHIEVIDKDNPKTIEVGPFKVDPFHVNHNIPDAIGLAIQTPVGQVIHTCDFKFDFQPVADKPADLARIVQLASRGTLLLLSDSTGAENPGHSMSERVIMDNLDEVFENAKGRIIVSTFASLIGRVQQVIWLAEKYGRKVAVEGYSMKSNVAIARELKYIETQKGTLIKPEDALDLPDDKVVVVCTGAQGEDRAVLMRIVNKEHRYFKIKPGDTVIFSSSIVPGNERAVQNLKDGLYRQGAHVFHYKMMDIHASGHAYAEDLKLMLNLVQPKFLVPIHGQYFMLRAHAELAQSVGLSKENIVIASNGSIIEVRADKVELTGQRVPTDYVMIDGSGVGDVGEVVLRDRQIMSQDGIMVAVVLLDKKTNKVKLEPDIISRGFVYMRESRDLIKEVKRRTREAVERYAKKEASRRRTGNSNDNFLKNIVRDELNNFLFYKTQRRPMVIPVIIRI